MMAYLWNKAKNMYRKYIFKLWKEKKKIKLSRLKSEYNRILTKFVKTDWLIPKQNPLNKPNPYVVINIQFFHQNAFCPHLQARRRKNPNSK